MKIVSFNEGQSGNEWLEWRKNGIGASDIAVIMGSNPHMTPYALWEEKCGFGKKKELTNPMKHGIANEEKARKWVNKNALLNLKPLCVEDTKNPFFRASLDGYDIDKEFLVEIKCPVNEEVLHNAREKQSVPLYWQHQIQWQIMLANPKRAQLAIWDYRYASCMMIEMFAQPSLQEEMIIKATEFWRQVQMGIAPKISEKDYVELDDPSLKELLSEYDDHDKVAKLAELRKKELKKEILKFGDGNNFRAFNHSVTFCSGRLGYDIEQMKMDGIDVEKYVKKSSNGFYRISSKG